MLIPSPPPPKEVVLLRSKDVNDRKWELIAISGVFVLLSHLNVAVGSPGYALCMGELRLLSS